MRVEYFLLANGARRNQLDPRAKLLLLVAINLVMFGTDLEGIDLAPRLLCAAIPFFALWSIGRRRAAWWYFAVYAVVLPLETLVLPQTRGPLNFALLMATGMFSRLLAGCAFAAYLMASTTVSEFLTAMRRMRAPDAIAIPLAAMFRYFPTLAEEAGAIRDAMRMRGMRGMGAALRSPLAHLERALVPLMMSTLRIGDELTAAALTKGLGSGPRTHIQEIRMRPRDWAACALALALVAYMFARHSLLSGRLSS